MSGRRGFSQEWAEWGSSLFLTREMAPPGWEVRSPVKGLLFVWVFLWFLFRCHGYIPLPSYATCFSDILMIRMHSNRLHQLN